MKYERWGCGVSCRANFVCQFVLPARCKLRVANFLSVDDEFVWAPLTVVRGEGRYEREIKCLSARYLQSESPWAPLTGGRGVGRYEGEIKYLSACYLQSESTWAPLAGLVKGST